MSEDEDIPDERLEPEGIRQKPKSNEQLREKDFESKSISENISSSVQPETTNYKLQLWKYSPRPRTRKK